jgi:hypothetical protein
MHASRSHAIGRQEISNCVALVLSNDMVLLISFHTQLPEYCAPVSKWLTPISGMSYPVPGTQNHRSRETRPSGETSYSAAEWIKICGWTLTIAEADLGQKSFNLNVRISP